MKIDGLPNGFLIEDKFLFCAENPMPEYINLMHYRGLDMNYGLKDYTQIDFPGEYDKDGIFIKVVESDDKKLNYFIRYDGSNFAIIQSPKVIETEEFENISCWIYTEEFTVNVLDKLETEGERYLISEGVVTEMEAIESTKE